MIGGAGGVAPLQYKLRRFPAPHCSLALPVHGKLQSEGEAFVPPFEMTSPQSCIQKRTVRTTEIQEKRTHQGTLNRALTALLTILNTGVDKVLIIAVTDTILDGHITCVRVLSRRKRARCNIVPRVRCQRNGLLVMILG